MFNPHPFIFQINSDGAAGSDGRLKPGMRIVEVIQNDFMYISGATSSRKFRN